VGGKTYNADNQKTNSGFACDGDGNPTTYNHTSITYDVEDRLTSAGSALTASYDATNNRTSTTTSAGTAYFLYDGDSVVPVCELYSSGLLWQLILSGPTV
jgi:hypothetical protein